MDELRILPLYDRGGMTHLRISSKGNYECDVRFSRSGIVQTIVEKSPHECICIVTEFAMLGVKHVISVTIHSIGEGGNDVDFRFLPDIVALSKRHKIPFDTCSELLTLYLIRLAVQYPCTTSSINYILRAVYD